MISLLYTCLLHTHDSIKYPLKLSRYYPGSHVREQVRIWSWFFQWLWQEKKIYLRSQSFCLKAVQLKTYWLWKPLFYLTKATKTMGGRIWWRKEAMAFSLYLRPTHEQTFFKLYEVWKVSIVYLVYFSEIVVDSIDFAFKIVLRKSRLSMECQILNSNLICWSISCACIFSHANVTIRSSFTT